MVLPQDFVFQGVGYYVLILCKISQDLTELESFSLGHVVKAEGGGRNMLIINVSIVVTLEETKGRRMKMAW